MKNVKLARRLILVRHGEAEGNREMVFLGRRNDDLTQHGVTQAHARAAALRGRSVDALSASPLLRAKRTAEILGEALDLTPQFEPRLMEQDFGAWDGRKFEEVAGEFTDDFQAWRNGGGEMAPTGGESLDAVAQRVASFYNDLAERYGEGQTVILVGHAANLQSLLCGLFQIPLRSLWPFRLQNASQSEVEIINDLPVLTRLSVT